MSGSQDNLVRIWDLLSLRNMAVLRGHSAPVTCLQVIIIILIIYYYFLTKQIIDPKW